MVTFVSSFSQIEQTFFQYVRDIAYATMVTVDAKGRPRARIMLPIWEVLDGRPVGWLAVFRTPVKAAHLAGNPHTTFSYWSPRQNAVFVDGIATWTTDGHSRRHSWDLYRKGGPSGPGYDPITFWPGGPGDPEYHVIRVEPQRVQVVRGRDLMSTIWRSPDRRAASGNAAEPVTQRS